MKHFTILPIDEFFGVIDQFYSKISKVPSVRSILAELSAVQNKHYIKAEWTLRYIYQKVQQGIVSWDNIKGFEITDNTKLVVPQYRVIDVKYSTPQTDKQRWEMKRRADWNANWSDDVFAAQFVKDLQQVTDIDEELRWRFDQRGNFTDAVWLKEKIVNALKSKGITLLNSIPESDNKDKIRSWFGVPVGQTPAAQFEMADIDYFFCSGNKFTLIFQN